MKFLESLPGTKVNLAIGMNFMTARGEEIQDFEGSLLKVQFPNSIFFSIEHPLGTEADMGRFTFEFWYFDQGAEEEEDELETVDGDYSLLTEVIGKYYPSPLIHNIVEIKDSF